MKLKLNKKRLKSLSKDSKTLPAEMTPLVGGGQLEVLEKPCSCCCCTCCTCKCG